MLNIVIKEFILNLAHSFHYFSIEGLNIPFFLVVIKISSDQSFPCHHQNKKKVQTSNEIPKKNFVQILNKIIHKFFGNNSNKNIRNGLKLSVVDKLSLLKS